MLKYYVVWWVGEAVRDRNILSIQPANTNSKHLTKGVTEVEWTSRVDY